MLRKIVTPASRRGASLATYAAVVGLVALGVSLAVGQIGDQVRGLTTKVAGSVNAVDGAISGNKGPSYQGPALADQIVGEFDAMAAIEARGFLDPEGDSLDYDLSLTGGLRPGDFTVQAFADGMVVDGTPSGDGTLTVIATDPIGRKATAGPVQITVTPNRAPDIGAAPAPMAVTKGTRVSVVFTGVDDLDNDGLTYALDTGSSPAFSRSGSDLTVTFTADRAGSQAPVLTVTDDHGAATQAPAFPLEVHAHTCQDLLDDDPTVPDGAHTIDPDGPGGAGTMQVFCDMTTAGGGWTMVFKKSRGVHSDARATFLAGYANNHLTDYLDKDRESGEYANRIITDHWGQFGEARVELVEGGVAQAHMTFDLAGTTNETWYADARLTGSSWTDLAGQTKNYFSILGHDAPGTTRRHFFVNHVYGGCPNDVGWVTTLSEDDVCSLDWRFHRHGDIPYSASSTMQNFASGNVRNADAFVVMVR